MKQRFTSISILLFITIIAKAGPVSLSQARSYAQKALQSSNMARGKNASTTPQTLKLAFTRTADKVIAGTPNYPLFYVFDNGNENGFVIVAGDDNMKPILGICDNGHFDANTPVPGMRWWMAAIAASAQRIAENRNATTDNATEKVQAVTPLIKTRWAQNAPYNASCPIDTICRESQTSVTGCVATALAQIFNYWQYPKQITGSVSYQVNTKQAHSDIDDNKQTLPENITYKFNLADYPFDYAGMKQSYNKNSESEDTRSVANLMLVCGAAMHMNYCQYSSGSNIDRNVLTQTFGYDKSCHCLSRNFFTPREWSRALAAELQAGRPILYSATSDYEGGHEFICDGIDEEGRFHFNWGWGGLHNGYYDITPLDPSTMQTYIGNQIATIGIQPDLGGENLHISNDISYSELNVSIELNHLTHQSYLMASLAGLSALETTANAKMGYILYDCNGNIIKKGINNNNISLEPGLYYSNYPLVNITFGKNFEDGTYYLVPAYGESSEDLQPITGGSSKTYKDYIVVTIKNRNISASLSKTQSKDDIRLAISKNLTTKEDGTNILYAGVSNNISFDITNNGENYDGTLEIIHRTKQTTEGPEGSKEIEIEDTKARTLINIEKGETQTITQAINADEGEITLEVWTYQTNNGEKKKIGELTYTGKPTSEGAHNLSIENVEILTPRITLNQDLKFKITINNTGGFFQGRLQCGIQTRQENYIYSSSPSTNEVISIDKEQKTFILSLPVYHLFDGLDITTGKGTLLNRYEFTVVDDATGISNSTITAASHKAMIYSINGTPCGYDLETLPKGIYIQSGKKIIK